MDKKTLWALTISFLILAVWSVIYPRLFPPPPVPPVTDQATAGAPAGATGATGAGLAGASGAVSPAAPGSAATPGNGGDAEQASAGEAQGSAPAPKLEAPAGTPPVVVETQFARIEIASEGGSIRSWTLSQYRDEAGKPYDLVSAESRTSGIYPLQFSSGIGRDYEASDVERAVALASRKLGRPAASLQTEIVDEGRRGFLFWGHRPAVVHVLNVADPLEALNKARFVIERGPGAKGDKTELVKLSYSDGLGIEASKTLEFSEDSYFVRVSAEVTSFRQPVAAKIIWGPGIGTPSGNEPRRYEGAVSVRGWGGPNTHVLSQSVFEPRPVAEGSMAWGGAEEQYFAAIFNPAKGTMSVDVLPVFPPLPPSDEPPKPKPAESPQEEKIAPPKHLLVLIPAGETYDLYAGPKDYQLLTGLGRELPSLIEFDGSLPVIGVLIGWLAKALYAALRWLYGMVGNYGVGIIILTAAVKILFYPITQRTMVKMRQVQAQMAKLKPKQDAIRNKYKKAKDMASRNKMNEEIMELMRKEGVNPMASLGGCLPLLVQLPILYGFYKVLNIAIELRQAPFFGWIRDLSRSDPYYITPIVMGISMFLQQRLAMMTTNTADPQQQMQQRMMLLMPLIFTWTFLHLPSGLVLYWFVNNVLGIAQQILINRQAKALDARTAAQAAGKA